MIKLLLLFLSLLSTVMAQYTPNVDSQTYGADGTITISWTVPSSNKLVLTDQDTGKFLLCTCNSTGFGCNEIPNQDSISIKDQSSTSFKVSDVASFGPSGYYTIQMVTLNSNDKTQYAISYLQNFFEITAGMTGSGEADKSCGTPGSQENGVPNTASSSTVWSTSYTLPQSLATLSGYDIPYTWQRGPTRTAPFVMTPGSKVTMTYTPTNRTPTSSYTPYKSYFINPSLPVVTGTPSPSVVVTQAINTAQTLATTPSGRSPQRVLPTLSIAVQSTSDSKQKRRVRRWA